MTRAQAIKTLTIFALLAFSLASQADTFSGLLKIERGQRYLQRPSQPDVKLTARGRVKTSLYKIANNDFLVIEGRYRQGEKSIYVQSIEAVEVKRLIGEWRNFDWRFYTFNSFTVQFDDPYISKDGKDLEYRLTPGRGNEWSIFLVGDSGIYLGSLVMIGRHLKMSFYDRVSGQIVHKVKLTRFAD